MLKFLSPFIVSCCLTSFLCAGESLIEGRPVVPLPFATDPDMPRSFIDLDVVDPAAVGGADAFLLEYRCPKPAAVASVVLYFQSENGWYSRRFARLIPVAGTTDRFRLVAERSGFKTEATPGPWDKANKIRVAVYHGENLDTELTVERMEAHPYTTLALIPNEESRRGTVRNMIRRLGRLGVPTGTLPQENLSEKALAGRSVVILADNTPLTTEQTAVLQTFVEQGGKLIAFYILPPELQKSLGFGPSKYLRTPEGDRALAEIRFDKESPFATVFPGLESIEQKSWNIQTNMPLDGADGRNASVAAWWYDASGKRTEYPALLLSDRGAFFSHVLTPEDAEKKDAFLLDLVMRYDDRLVLRRVLTAWQSLFLIGKTGNPTPEAMKAAQQDFLARLKKSGFDVKADFFTDLDNDRPVDVSAFAPVALLKALETIHADELRRFCAAAPSRDVEFRAWWEHSGLGPYPGDWDRTMREVAASGFNAVIPNMLWAGTAHYASDVLPRSKKFEQYGDQVEQAVAAGKKHGVQVHVWKVNYYLTGAPKEFVEEMRKAGRLQKTYQGLEFDPAGSYRAPWLCPSHPANIELEWKSMVEVVRKYDVDGIHFDYIRYPNGDYCYCDGCRERFAGETGTVVADWPKDVWKQGEARNKYRAWRCTNISKLVERVHVESKKIRPTVRISAAVFREHPEVMNSVGQDWRLWTEKGWIDFLCPMDYTESLAQFDRWVRSQVPISKVPVYPGIGAASSGSRLTPADVVVQIELARELGTKGFVLFNLNGKTIGEFSPLLHLGVTKQKAAVP